MPDRCETSPPQKVGRCIVIIWASDSIYYLKLASNRAGIVVIKPETQHKPALTIAETTFGVQQI